MFDIVQKFRERGRALEPGARDCLQGQKSYRIRIVAGATLFLAMAVPSPGWADIYGTVSAEGYTFTNFDPTLLGGAVGSNANGISNAGQVVGITVSPVNPALYNYSGTPRSTMDRPAGRIDPCEGKSRIHAPSLFMGAIIPEAGSRWLTRYNGVCQTRPSQKRRGNGFAISSWRR